MAKPIKVDVKLLQAEVSEWVAKWQLRLHIPEWDIKVEIGEAGRYRQSGVVAEIHWHEEYLMATLLVYPEGKAFPDEVHLGLEFAVLHELCHLYSAETVRVMEDLIANLPRAERKWFKESERRAGENLTERIARTAWKAYSEGEHNGRVD